MTNIIILIRAYRLLVAFCLLCLAGNAIAGVVIGSTRVVVRESHPQTTIYLHATGSIPYLVIGRVLNTSARISGDMSDKAEGFTVLPPAFVIKGGQERQLIIRTTDTQLPYDRESMMYFLVSALPEGGEDKNVVQVAVRTWIKLFFRPKALEGQTISAVKVIRRDNEVIMKNVSPFYISLSGMQIGGREIRSPSDIIPFGERRFQGCVVSTTFCEVIWTQVGEDNRSRSYAITLPR
ncbi:fimbrial biogenesis chaperone [Enterobacter kobei]|uniref:fimbrial biogenesis chaperone n=1 Tax=Enterobacter kobei TaxID=208224 RepID=UPI0012562A66|nr:molecular chaperone [Enterobacter kobei]VAL18820.1 Pili assembly chaperone, N-terminal protein [Enterobacter kobei]